MSEIFPPDYYAREDETDDTLFYRALDATPPLPPDAATALADLLWDLLPQEATILDLMSGPRSYVPIDCHPSRMVGLGPDGSGMKLNRQLDEFRVQDLNRKPGLPFAPGQFDAVLCLNGIQYLTRPVAIFSEVHQLLKEDGLFIVSFSATLHTNKVVAIWESLDDMQRIALIHSYYRVSGAWANASIRIKESVDSGSLYMLWAQKHSL